jgi:prevent-host-death family protein
MALSPQSRTISATEFKAHCLALMDEVQRTGEELVITKHGKPVARLAPVVSAAAPSVVGWMRGTSEVLGDLIGPEDVWNLDDPLDPTAPRQSDER